MLILLITHLPNSCSQSHSHALSSLLSTMMSDNTHFHSVYTHVPILTKDNYPLWALRIKAYLTLNDHGCVIHCETVGLVEVDPTVPAPQDTGYDTWVKSKQVAISLIISTAADLHFEFCHAHERSPAWDLWCAIKNCHIVQDASLRYDTWMGLLPSARHLARHIVT